MMRWVMPTLMALVMALCTLTLELLRERNNLTEMQTMLLRSEVGLRHDAENTVYEGVAQPNPVQKVVGEVMLTADSPATEDRTVLFPPITQESAQAALDSLDESQLWKKQVTFMGIGAPKSGSTSVFSFLRSHNMTRSKCKECQCYLYDWKSSDPDCERFYRIPKKENENFIVGEFSPGYLAHSERVVPRVAEAYPWIKLIAILRDPASRSLSQYHMRMKNGKTNYTFTEYVLGDLAELRSAGMLPHWKIDIPSSKKPTLEQWLSAPIDDEAFEEFFGSKEMVRAWQRYHTKAKGSKFRRNISTGLYAVSLHRWLSVFPRERFIVLNMHDLSREGGTDLMMSRVHKFLDIPVQRLGNQEPSNKGSYHDPMPEDVKILLGRAYAPFTRQLESMFGYEWRDPFRR